VRFRQDFFEEAPSAVGNRKTKVKINWGSPLPPPCPLQAIKPGKTRTGNKNKGRQHRCGQCHNAIAVRAQLWPCLSPLSPLSRSTRGFPPFPTFLFGRPLGRNRVRLAVETKTQKLRPAQVLHLTGKNRAENPKEKQ